MSNLNNSNKKSQKAERQVSNMGPSSNDRDDSNMQSEQDFTQSRSKPMRVAAMRPENQEFKVAGEELGGGVMHQKVQPSFKAGPAVTDDKGFTLPLVADKFVARETVVGRKPEEAVNLNQNLDRPVKVGINRPTVALFSSMGGDRSSSSTDIDFGGSSTKKTTESTQPKQFEYKAEDFPEPSAAHSRQSKKTSSPIVKKASEVKKSTESNTTDLGSKETSEPLDANKVSMPATSSGSSYYGLEPAFFKKDAEGQTSSSASHQPYQHHHSHEHGSTHQDYAHQARTHQARVHQARARDVTPEMNLGSLFPEDQETSSSSEKFDSRATSLGRSLVGSAPSGHRVSGAGKPSVASAAPWTKTSKQSATDQEHRHKQIRADTPEMNLGLLFPEDETALSSLHSLPQMESNKKEKSTKMSKHSVSALKHRHDQKRADTPEMNLGTLFPEDETAPSSLHSLPQMQSNRREETQMQSPYVDSVILDDEVAEMGATGGVSKMPVIVPLKSLLHDPFKAAASKSWNKDTTAAFQESESPMSHQDVPETRSFFYQASASGPATGHGPSAVIHKSAMPPVHRDGPAHHPAPEYGSIQSGSSSSSADHADPMHHAHAAPIYHAAGPAAVSSSLSKSATSDPKFGAPGSQEMISEMKTREPELMTSATGLRSPIIDDDGSSSGVFSSKDSSIGKPVLGRSLEKESLQNTSAIATPESTAVPTHGASHSSRMPNRVLGKSLDEPLAQLPSKPVQVHHGGATEGLNQASFPSFARQSVEAASLLPTAPPRQSHASSRTDMIGAFPKHNKKPSKRERKAAKKYEASRRLSVLDSISSALVGRRKNSVSTPVMHLNEIFGEASLPLPPSDDQYSGHGGALGGASVPQAATAVAAGLGEGIRSIFGSIHMPTLMSHRQSSENILPTFTQDTEKLDVTFRHASAVKDDHDHKHESSKAAMLKSPKVDPKLLPEEQATYPRGDDVKTHENPARPRNIVEVTELPYKKPETLSKKAESKGLSSSRATGMEKSRGVPAAIPMAAVAPMILDLHAHRTAIEPVILDVHTHTPHSHAAASSKLEHGQPAKMQASHAAWTSTVAPKQLKKGHSTAAMLKKPKGSLFLFPEEEANYPRGGHESLGSARMDMARRSITRGAVPIKEIQLDDEQMHSHHDLHPTMSESAAAAVNQGIEGLKSLWEGISLPASGTDHSSLADLATTAVASTMAAAAMHHVPASPTTAHTTDHPRHSAPVVVPVVHKAVPRVHSDPLQWAPTSANTLSLDSESKEAVKPKEVKRDLPLMYGTPVRSAGVAPEKAEHHHHHGPVVAPILATVPIGLAAASAQRHRHDAAPAVTSVSVPSARSSQKQPLQQWTSGKERDFRQHHRRHMEIPSLTEGLETFGDTTAEKMKSPTARNVPMMQDNKRGLKPKTDPSVVLTRKLRPSLVLPPSAKTHKGIMIAGAVATAAPIVAATAPTSHHREVPKSTTTSAAKIPIAQPPKDVSSMGLSSDSGSKADRHAPKVPIAQPPTMTMTAGPTLMMAPAPKIPAASAVAHGTNQAQGGMHTASGAPAMTALHHHHQQHHRAAHGAAPLMAAAAMSVKPDEVLIMESDPVDHNRAPMASSKSTKLAFVDSPHSYAAAAGHGHAHAHEPSTGSKRHIPIVTPRATVHNITATPPPTPSSPHDQDESQHELRNVAAPSVSAITAAAVAVPAASQDWTALHEHQPPHQHQQHQQHQKQQEHHQALPQKDKKTETAKPLLAKGTDKDDVKVQHVRIQEQQHDKEFRMPSHAPAPALEPSPAQKYAASYNNNIKSELRPTLGASTVATAALLPAAGLEEDVYKPSMLLEQNVSPLPTPKDTDIATPSSIMGSNKVVQQQQQQQQHQQQHQQQQEMNVLPVKDQDVKISSLPSDAAKANTLANAPRSANLQQQAQQPVMNKSMDNKTTTMSGSTTSQHPPVPPPRPGFTAATAVPVVAATAATGIASHKDVDTIDNVHSDNTIQQQPYQQQHEQQHPMDIQPASTSTSTTQVVEKPDHYQGPIPAVEDGDRVIWVKKIYTTEEFYDGGDENEGEEVLDEYGYRLDRDVSLNLPRRR